MQRWKIAITMKLVRCRYVNNCIFYTFIKLIVRNLKKDFTILFTDKNNQKVANKIEELIIKAIGHIRLMLANMCMCLFVHTGYHSAAGRCPA